jgi:hypothetical protein
MMYKSKGKGGTVRAGGMPVKRPYGGGNILGGHGATKSGGKSAKIVGVRKGGKNSY